MNRNPFLIHAAAIAIVVLPLAAQAQNQPMTPSAGIPGATAAAPESTVVAFKRADVNGDNKISKQEAEKLPKVAARFDELDKDKDGFLSLVEFAAAFVDPK